MDEILDYLHELEKRIENIELQLALNIREDWIYEQTIDEGNGLSVATYHHRNDFWTKRNITYKDGKPIGVS